MPQPSPQRPSEGALAMYKNAEFGSPWFAQSDQIKEKTEVASASVA